MPPDTPAKAGYGVYGQYLNQHVHDLGFKWTNRFYVMFSKATYSKLWLLGTLITFWARVRLIMGHCPIFLEDDGFSKMRTKNLLMWFQLFLSFLISKPFARNIFKCKTQPLSFSSLINHRSVL